MKRARAIAAEFAEQERSTEAVNKTLEDRRLIAVAPNGFAILGTYERITGRAEIGSWHRRASDGGIGYDHAGETEVFWDGQLTMEHGTTGEPLFLDEDGHVWRESQLRLLPEAEGVDAVEGEPCEPTTIDLDDRELFTIVAALRYRRAGLAKDASGGEFDSVATNGGRFDALGLEEIDALCKRLGVE